MPKMPNADIQWTLQPTLTALPNEFLLMNEHNIWMLLKPSACRNIIIWQYYCMLAIYADICHIALSVIQLSLTMCDIMDSDESSCSVFDHISQFLCIHVHYLQNVINILSFACFFLFSSTFNDFSRESYRLTVWLKHSSLCFRISPSRVFFVFISANHYLTRILIIFLQYQVSKAFTCIHFCKEGGIEVKYGQT